MAAAVGLCRHDVRICDGSCWVWSNGSDIWKRVMVSNLFARCGSFSCLVSKVVDSEERVFCAKMVKTFKRIAGSARLHVFHHSLLVTVHNADGNVFNSSVLTPCAMAFHNVSSQNVAEEDLFSLQEIQWMKNSERSQKCTSTRGEMSLRTPLRTTTWQCVTRYLWSRLTINSILA